MGLRYSLLTAAIVPFVLISACGGGGSSSPPVIISPPPPLPPPPPPPPPPPIPTPTSVEISGRITFDSVPHNPVTNGLNYANTQRRPVRGVNVDLVNAAGTILDSSVTDPNGTYSFTLASNTNVRVRVKAEMIQTGDASWNLSVRDNTSGNALYTLNGSLADSGVANSVRDLNAGSGWGGTRYTGTRTAGPFAILSPLYDTLKAFEAIDSNIDFPPVQFRWSINNRSVNGNRADGEIGTSSYLSSQNAVFILGDDDVDSDEYDEHVVVHEFGHYFEDKLGRSDSLGGNHSIGDRLDARVAFSEGWGNAISGLILDDPIYRDSQGSMQSGGFSFNVENNTPSNKGWFNESSVHSILYDLADTADDGDDTFSLGLGALYQGFQSPTFRSSPVFTTIFSYLEAIRSADPAFVTAVDTLAAGQDIDGTGAKGTGETNDGNISEALPLYKSANINGPAVEVCSLNDAGVFNKLANRSYVVFDVTTAGIHTLTMTRKNGPTGRDPDFVLYRDGVVVARADDPPANSETLTVTLHTGTYVADTYDFLNIQEGLAAGDSCYDFRVTG